VNDRCIPLVVVLSIACLLFTQAALCEAITASDELNWIATQFPCPSRSGSRTRSLSRRARWQWTPRGQGCRGRAGRQGAVRVLGGAPAGEPAFTVKILTGGADAEPLAKLKNFDQAYRIYPVGKKELRLVAITPNGAYYGRQDPPAAHTGRATTAPQALRARASATSDKIEMPLVTVTDWPDLEDRGLWGTDNFAELKWLGDRKMNWMEQISHHGVDEDGVPFAKVKGGREPLVDEAYLYGMNFVPVVLHLEQSSRAGALQAYPYIKGVSAHTGVMCYSQPKTAWIISKWIAELVSLPHVNEVDVWMSENLQGRRAACATCAGLRELTDGAGGPGGDQGVAGSREPAWPQDRAPAAHERSHRESQPRHPLGAAEGGQAGVLSQPADLLLRQASANAQVPGRLRAERRMGCDLPQRVRNRPGHAAVRERTVCPLQSQGAC